MGICSSKDATTSAKAPGGIADGVVEAPQKQGKNPSLHGNLVQQDQRVEDVYNVSTQLGKGAASKILHANDKKYTKTNRTSGGYAIKLYDGKAEIPPDLGKEASILMSCDHPNIIKLYEMAKINRRISLVLELCTGGSLTDRMPYTEEDCSRIMRQLLSAVAYLHHKHIVHRDIELTNILFENDDPKSDIKLIDFGCATKLQEHPDRPGVFKALQKKTGSVIIMSPEMLKMPNRYSAKTDVWSCGVVAYMLLCDGRKPFDGDNIEEIEAAITKGYPSYTDWKHSKLSMKFVQDLLNQDPQTRPTAANALNHEWIAKSRPKIMIPNSLVISFDLYARSSPIKRVALNALARKASPERVAEYRQLFRDLDINQSGTLTHDEFMNGFRKTGSSQEELENLFHKLDVNCNDEIMYTEFLAASLEAGGPLEEAQLQEAFDLLDEDHSGVISKKNLLKMLGHSPKVKDSISEMLEGHDDLDFYDFQEMFQHNANLGDRNVGTIIEEEIVEEGDEEEEE